MKFGTLVKQSQHFNRDYFHDNWCPICDFLDFWIFWKKDVVAVHWKKIPIKITVLAQYSCSIFTHAQTHTHARENLVFDNLLYTGFYTVYSILFCIQYEINRKMKMLQEYWASTVIFIGIFAQCNFRKILAIVLKLHTNILHPSRNFGIEFGQNRLNHSNVFRFWMFWEFFHNCLTQANFDLSSWNFARKCSNAEWCLIPNFIRIVGDL